MASEVELIWPGKYDEHGQRAPLHRRHPALDCCERWGEVPSPNRLVRGDNHDVLDALLDSHAGKIDLVYIDPPFNTGQAFSVTRTLQGTEGGKHELRLPAYRDSWEEGAAGFLRMLDPRLRMIHELLSPKGSLYLHIDPRWGHAVRLLLDEIFGARCFQREIAWRIGWVSGYKTRARNWIRNHDSIFFYVKDPDQFTFNKHYAAYPEGYRRRDGSLPTGQGIPMEDVWNANEAEFALSGRDSLDSIQIKSFSREKTGWATQKNESLLERIIAASSDPGDLVADFFSGSGTTALVAARLGRRFIASDISPVAIQIAAERLHDAHLGHYALEQIRDAARPTSDTDALSALARWLEKEGGLEQAPQPFLGARGKTALFALGPSRTLTGAEARSLLERLADQPQWDYESIEFYAWGWDSQWEQSVIAELGNAAVAVACFQVSREGKAFRIAQRPQIVVEPQLGPEGLCLRLAGYLCSRPDRLPEALRRCSWTETIRTWTVARFDDPLRPLWRGQRNSTRDSSLPLYSPSLASLHSHGEGPWLVRVEDCRGFRFSTRVDVAGSGDARAS